MIYVNENRKPGDDIFFSDFSKISLQNELGQGSQVEGITNINNNGEYYISREFFSRNIGGHQFSFPQKLYQFYDEAHPLLSIKKNDFENLKITPNPTSNKIFLNSKNTIQKVSIFNTIGKKVLEVLNHQKEIDISSLPKGIYLIKIQFDTQKSLFRKVIKL